MRQEQIVKKPRRRTTRQAEVAPLKHAAAADLSEADEILAAIEQLLAVA